MVEEVDVGLFVGGEISQAETKFRQLEHRDPLLRRLIFLIRNRAVRNGSQSDIRIISWQLRSSKSNSIRIGLWFECCIDKSEISEIREFNKHTRASTLVLVVH